MFGSKVKRLLSSTVKLTRVNVRLLERQRLILSTIDRDKLTGDQAAALDGVQNMLDTWSDERHEKQEKVS